MKYLLTFALLVVPVVAQADSVRVPLVRVTDKLLVSDIDSYLESKTVLPLLGNTADLLAINLWNAQFVANLGQPDSLLLSENAVLKAIWIQEEYWHDTFCDSSNCAIMWAQSNIAINDQAQLTITPSSIDFGSVPTVVTPEPGTTLSLACIGLLALAIAGARLSFGRKERRQAVV
jgi:hypothetical protein